MTPAVLKLTTNVSVASAQKGLELAPFRPLFQLETSAAAGATVWGQRSVTPGSIRNQQAVSVIPFRKDFDFILTGRGRASTSLHALLVVFPFCTCDGHRMSTDASNRKDAISERKSDAR